MRTRTRLTPILLAAGALALTAAGCGDDGGTTPDARRDAAPTGDGPEADGPAAHKIDGRFAITDVALTTPGAEVSPTGAAIGGGALSIVFEDTNVGGGEVLHDSLTLTSGCIVTHFTAGATSAHPPHPPVDLGPVTLSGGGLLGPATDPCTFEDGEYECQVTAAAGGVGTALAGMYVTRDADPRPNVESFVTTFIIGGNAPPDFTGKLGTWVEVTGITGDGSDKVTGRFPVIAVEGVPHSFTVANPKATAATAAPVAFTGMNFSLYWGAGPVPGGAAPDPATGLPKVNYLGDGMAAVDISVPASQYFGAINKSLAPGGQGLILGDGCADCIQPHEMPIRIDAADTTTTVSFSCQTADGGNCGTSPTVAMGIPALVVAGVAVDADDAAISPVPFLMPPQESWLSWTSFNCRIAGDGLQIPNDALKAIVSVNPDRIETRVFRFNGLPPQTDGTTGNTYAVVVGHGLIGHRSAPPPQP